MLSKRVSTPTEMFSHQEDTLQRLCAMTFWLNRVASAATDVAIGESLNNNPVGELVDRLERLRDISEDWIQRIAPGHVSIKSGVDSGMESL